MEKIKEQYKKSGKYFLNNKIFIVAIILITILSFGFTVTNSSVGMDDTAFDRYYQDKEMLAIGRWGSYLVYQILNITEFIPFWIDFLASSIIMLTAVMWCCSKACSRNSGKMNTFFSKITQVAPRRSVW